MLKPKRTLDKFQTVLITGASSGIGEEFAHQLAVNSKRMVLVARQYGDLQRVEKELLKKKPNLHICLVVKDLSISEQRNDLYDYLVENQIHPDLLVNNAGMGDYGEFVEGEWSKISAMMEINMTALTHITHLLLPSMQTKDFAGIINVSSLASLLPIPDFSVYAATKAYVTSFSESLRVENAQTGVAITALCPGPVHTNFGAIAARNQGDKKFGSSEALFVSKEKVVREGLNGILKNKAIVLPGLQVNLMGWLVDYLWRPILRLILATRPKQVSKNQPIGEKGLILASASPRRKNLLNKMGYDFDVVTSDVYEVHHQESSLIELCEINAGLKAAFVSKQYPNAIVIGCDTLVQHNNTALGKPKDLQEAKATLKRLSGDTHQVCSAVALMKNGEYIDQFHDTVDVTFKHLDDGTISEYISRVNVLDKAGSYAIQEFGEMVVDSFEGEFDTVMGLPTTLLDKKLQKHGIKK